MLVLRVSCRGQSCRSHQLIANLLRQQLRPRFFAYFAEVLPPRLASQSEHLDAEGCPHPLLVSAAERMQRKQKCRTPARGIQGQGTAETREIVVVIPYMRSMSHRPKKMGRVNVKVVFSALHNLSQLGSSTCLAK